MLAQLSPQDRQWLREREIILGQQTVFARAMLSDERLRTRAALCYAFENIRPSSAPDLPERRDPQAKLWVSDRHTDRTRCLRMGFVALGAVAVRCDALDQLLAAMAQLPAADQPARLSCTREVLACSEADAERVLQALVRSRRRRRRRSLRTSPPP